MFLRKVVLILVAMVVFLQPWGSGAFGMIALGPLGLMSILGILAFLFAVGYLLFGVPGFGKAAEPPGNFPIFSHFLFASSAPCPARLLPCETAVRRVQKED